MRRPKSSLNRIQKMVAVGITVIMLLIAGVAVAMLSIM